MIDENYDLFISYSHRDKRVVLELAKKLKANGLKVFLDVWELELGDLLVDKLEKAISKSKAGLLFYSNQAQNSKWVTEEYQRMINHSIKNSNFRLIPIRLDNTPLPEFVSSRVWYDLTEMEEEKTGDFVNEVLKSLGKEAPRISNSQMADVWLLGAELSHKILFILKGLDINREQCKSIWRISDILRDYYQYPLRQIEKCECGGIVYCGYADVGTVDYYDSYFHICAECLAHKFQYEHIYQGSETEIDIPRCPWCNYIWISRKG